MKADESLLFWEISSLLGEQGTFLLFDEFAGRRVYVPQTVKPGHRLSELLGFENAVKLSKKYGGDRLEIPTGRVSRPLKRAQIILIRKLRQRGLSVGAIAQKMSITRRTVFNAFTLELEKFQGHNYEQLCFFEVV